jgi:Flp pilus assembly protein TadG
MTGAAAVEFALVLPVFLILVFGLIELSLILYNSAVITNAAREAARAGVVLRQPKLSAAQIQQVALTYAQGQLISFGAATPPTVTVTTGVGGSFGTPLTVNVSYSYTSLGLSSFLSALGTPLVLSSTSVMSNE